jgi:hypothetical protein
MKLTIADNAQRKFDRELLAQLERICQAVGADPALGLFWRRSGSRRQLPGVKRVATGFNLALGVGGNHHFYTISEDPLEAAREVADRVTSPDFNISNEEE